MGATTNKPPTTVLVTSSRAYLMLALDGPSPRGRERGWPWFCVMSRHVKAGHVPIRGRTIIACIETTRVRALGFSPISTGGSEIAWLRLGLLHTAVRAETWDMDASLPPGPKSGSRGFSKRTGVALFLAAAGVSLAVG